MDVEAITDNSKYWQEFSDDVLKIHRNLCGQHPAETARFFYDLANRMAACKQNTEAEFLYLQAIHLWQRELHLEYPFVFKDVRALAKFLFEKYTEAVDDEQPIAA